MLRIDPFDLLAMYVANTRIAAQSLSHFSTVLFGLMVVMMMMSRIVCVLCAVLDDFLNRYVI